MLQCEYCEHFKVQSIDRNFHVKELMVCQLTEYIFDRYTADSCLVYPCESTKYKDNSANRELCIKPDWKFSYRKGHVKPFTTAPKKYSEVKPLNCRYEH